MVKLFIVTSLLILLICNGGGVQGRVKLSIYYETLCPDSTRFFKNQLKRAYEKIGSHFDTDFIPYGLAMREKVNGKWEFKCQHGESECNGNKLHACALEQNSSKDKNLKLLVCSMSSRNPASSNALQMCAKDVGIDFDPINKCFKSEEADELLAKYGEQTDAVTPNIFYVPTIIINDVYNQTVQDGAEADLVQTICESLEHKPKECSS